MQPDLLASELGDHALDMPAGIVRGDVGRALRAWSGQMRRGDRVLVSASDAPVWATVRQDLGGIAGRRTETAGPRSVAPRPTTRIARSTRRCSPGSATDPRSLPRCRLTTRTQGG